MNRTPGFLSLPRWGAALAGLALAVGMAAQPLSVAEARALQEHFDQRYQRLSGLVEDLLAAQVTLQKRVDALANEVRSLREEQSRRPADVVTQQDLTRAIESLRNAINKQREDEGRKVLEELKRINTLVARLGDTGRSAPVPPPTRPAHGYEYEIKAGDTLSAIVQAYRNAGVKGLTVDQVLQANRGLRPETLIPGRTIFIPDPDKN